MLKKTITYVDFDGNERTEDFYFHLTKAELSELEYSQEGGMRNKIEKIVKDENGKEILATFKEILLLSYGQKSEDGRRFIKSKELREEFSQTEAYSQLYMELASNADAAAAFINSVVPSK